MTTGGTRLELVADAPGERLDRFLALKHPEFSRSRLSQLIEEESVLVDGAAAKASLRLRGGERIILEVPPPEPAIPQAENLPITVLHDDPDLVVVNKAAGMVVHPAAGISSGTLVNALLHHVKDLSGIGGELRPGIVHRLDKDTSGVLVVAKNDFTLGRLQHAFQDREVDKRYVALVHGSPAKSGTFDTLIGRHPTDRVRMTTKLKEGGPGVRRAITHWTVAETFGVEATRVDINLETGRTHQIRVHFSEGGFPLLADEPYGGTKRDNRAVDLVRRAAKAIGRQALHAASISFVHPRTGATLRVEAPLPPDFQAALALLRQIPND